MAKALQYVLSDGDAARDVRVITYGKCTKSPYAENGLWFVHIPQISENSTTFLVTEEYVRSKVMDDFEIDLEKWSEIAQKIIPGDWNLEEECLWRNMPFCVHVLPDGTPVRYGLSRSQSTKYPNREFWYIVIGLGHDRPVDLSYDVLHEDRASIHVGKGSQHDSTDAKIWLEPQVEVAHAGRSLNRSDLKRALNSITQNLNRLLEAWHAHRRRTN